MGQLMYMITLRIKQSTTDHLVYLAHKEALAKLSVLGSSIMQLQDAHQVVKSIPSAIIRCQSSISNALSVRYSERS